MDSMFTIGDLSALKNLIAPNEDSSDDERVSPRSFLVLALRVVQQFKRWNLFIIISM